MAGSLFTQLLSVFTIVWLSNLVLVATSPFHPIQLDYSLLPRDLAISSNGSCGALNGNTTCLGSAEGNCCSRLGYCGSNASYCGQGCQLPYGKCGNAKISTDGSCGGAGGISCLGSAEGNCCSRLGYCGNNASYCGSGCQSTLGDCWESSNNPTSSAGASPSVSPAQLPVTETVGFKAGIGVAAGVVGIALIGLLIWLARRSRAPAVPEKSLDPRPDAKYILPELAPTPTLELMTEEFKELSAQHPGQDSQYDRYELAATEVEVKRDSIAFEKPELPAEPAETHPSQRRSARF